MSATLSTTLATASTQRPPEYLWILTACWKAIARYFNYRAAIESLRGLDDRELRDIGLARSEIEAAVRGLITRARTQ